MFLSGSARRSLIFLQHVPAYRRFLAATRRPERARQASGRRSRRSSARRICGADAFRPDLRDYDITTLDFYRPALEQSLHTGTSAAERGTRAVLVAERGHDRRPEAVPDDRVVPAAVPADGAADGPRRSLRRYPRFLERPVAVLRGHRSPGTERDRHRDRLHQQLQLPHDPRDAAGAVRVPAGGAPRRGDLRSVRAGLRAAG